MILSGDWPLQAVRDRPAHETGFGVRLGQDFSSVPEPKEERAARRGTRILIIEDNRDAADSLRMFLELLGHQVTVAYTGPDGLAAALAQLPPIILCDIGLPGMDGYAIARELRRNPGTRGVRLIAISGYAREEDRRQSQEAGFDYHLAKPADPDVLLRLIG